MKPYLFLYCDNVGGFVPTEMLSDIETGIVRPGPGSNLPSSSILGVTSLHPLSSAPPRPRSQHGPGQTLKLNSRPRNLLISFMMSNVKAFLLTG